MKVLGLKGNLSCPSNKTVEIKGISFFEWTEFNFKSIRRPHARKVYGMESYLTPHTGYDRPNIKVDPVLDGIKPFSFLILCHDQAIRQPTIAIQQTGVDTGLL